MEEISRRVKQYGGNSLIADYGEEQINGFTFRVSSLLQVLTMYDNDRVIGDRERWMYSPLQERLI